MSEEAEGKAADAWLNDPDAPKHAPADPPVYGVVRRGDVAVGFMRLRGIDTGTDSMLVLRDERAATNVAGAMRVIGEHMATKGQRVEDDQEGEERGEADG